MSMQKWNEALGNRDWKEGDDTYIRSAQHPSALSTEFDRDAG